MQASAEPLVIARVQREHLQCMMWNSFFAVETSTDGSQASRDGSFFLFRRGHKLTIHHQHPSTIIFDKIFLQTVYISYKPPVASPS